MNHDRTCRSCLEEEIPMISLYQCCKDIDENVQLNQIIQKLTKIEMRIDDGLPDKICEFCLEELKRICKFITLIQDSDKSLHSVEVLDTSIKDESFEEEYLEDELNDMSTDFKIEPMDISTPKIVIKSESNKDNNTSTTSYRSDEDVDDPEEENIDDPEEENVDNPEEENLSDREKRVNDSKDKNVNSAERNLNNPEEKHKSANIRQVRHKENVNEREHDYSKLLVPKNTEKDTCNGVKKKQNLFMCNICDKNFKSKNSLKTHKQDLHEFKYKCEFCEKSFPEKLNLNVHMRAHVTDDEKRFNCKECGALFSYQYLLTRHSYKHKDVKPFPCPKCDKGCLTADSLKRHLKVHDENYTKPTHICSVCKKEFLYPSFLAEHMKNHTGEKPFLCSHCGRGFRQKGALLYHVRSHQNIRPFKCDVCDNTFVSQGILRVHMRRHTNERPYVCDVCGRAFRQSSDCKMHRRIHFGLKLVECNVCKKKMSTTGQLTIHMRVHTGEKPYSCADCLKRFATRTVLAKHKRTHTGEKPYICSVCGRPFSQTSSLNTHMKIHLRTKDEEKKKKEKPEKPNQVIIVKLK